MNKANVLNTAAKIRQMIQEQCARFIEREELANGLALATMSAEHIIAFGPPGTGKSLQVNDWFARWIGARIFNNQAHQQQSADESLGPWDVKRIQETGEQVRRTDGYLPTAHFALLDEVARTAPTSMNAQLTLLNERIYREAGKNIPAPLITAAGGSNHELAGSEFEAADDRFLLRTEVRPIQEASNRAKLLKMAATGWKDAVPKTVTTATLEELQELHEAVGTVGITPQALEQMLSLRKQLETEKQIRLSDRRDAASIRVVQAHALLNDRWEATVEDLSALRFTYWLALEHRDAVHMAVDERTVPDMEAFLKWEGDLRKLTTDVERIDPGDSDVAKRNAGNAANNKLREMLSDVHAGAEQARREGRSADKHEAFALRVGHLRKRIIDVTLQLDGDFVTAEALSKVNT